VRELWGGIPPKITNTTCTIIDFPGKFFGSDLLFIPDSFSVCPVLTEKTIKGTSMIKNSKVLKPILWIRMMSKLRITRTGSSRADPIGNTIRRELIIIPAQIPPL
jgi:hypothetical protein